MPDNTVTVVGNVTREPELRFTNSGQAIATLGIAVNRRFQKNGEWSETTSFFNVTCWGQLGENAAASLPKGARVVVSGRLEQRSWETQDGDKRSAVDIIADEVAPSLRWATVEIVKNDRKPPSDTTHGGQARPQSAPAAAPYDEEPF